MPKVVVYVPAAAWRRMEQKGLDPAATVREFAKRGYEISGGGLSDGGRKQDVQGPSGRTSPQPPSESDDDGFQPLPAAYQPKEFKPDPKPTAKPKRTGFKKS